MLNSKPKYRHTSAILPQQLENDVFHIQNLFCINFVIICITIPLIMWLAGMHISFMDTNIIMPIYRDRISPKPIERACFFYTTLIVLSFSVCYIFLFYKKLLKLFVMQKPMVSIFITCLILILSYCLFTTDFINIVFGSVKFLENSSHGISKLTLYTMLGGGFALVYYTINSKHIMAECLYPNNKVHLWLLYILFLILSLFCACAWRIVSIYQIQENSMFYNEFEAVIYSLSQVVEGKHILVDLPSQYGLFPEFLKPIFSILSLNILSFSLTMFVLQFISISVVFYVLHRLIKNKLLLTLGVMALIIFTFNNLIFFSGRIYHFYQYWPVRFFWPAVSIGIFYYFCNHTSLSRSILMSLCAGLAVLWNLDTGLFIFIAFGAYLGLRILISFLAINKINSNIPTFALNKFNTKGWCIALIIHILVVILVCSSMLIYLKLSSGHELHLEWIYEYQKIYVGLGFMMLPIPTSHSPWMPVIGVYLYAFIVALYGFKKHQFNRRNDLLFYMSILGVGLFTYYEGRSHIENFLHVVWPSLIIGLILSDGIIRYIKYYSITILHNLFPAIFVTWILACSLVFLYNVPKMFEQIKLNIRAEPETLVVNEVNFIKSHTQKHQECLLLMKRAAIYYADSELSSPIKGPGLLELVFNKDLLKMEKQIMALRPECVFVGIGPTATPILNANDYTAILSGYKIVDKNSYGTIMFLRPE